MEGLPGHPLSQGGLCAVGQAQPIGLYDILRLKGPLSSGKPTDWTTVDREIEEAIQRIKADNRRVALVTPTITSPTLIAAIRDFLAQFGNSTHVILDGRSCSAILESHQQTHGARLTPHYRFDLAEVIVSFGADFLGTWISPAEFTAAWSTRRAPSETAPAMSFHVQFESRLSLTGSKADQRAVIHPDEEALLVARLADKLAHLSGSLPVKALTTDKIQDHEQLLTNLAERLWAARGKSLVISDSQDIANQRHINFINHLLGNYGTTVDILRPSLQRQGSDEDLAQLVDAVREGQISALLVADVELLHDVPDLQDLSQELSQIPLTVSFSQRLDSFASIAHYVCPDHHSLESWFDAEPVRGLISLAQPTLLPLNNSRSMLESLAVWSGQPTTAREAVQNYWEREVFPRRSSTAPSQFIKFWEQALQIGFVELDLEALPAGEFQGASLTSVVQQTPTEGLTVVLYHKVGMPDTRCAHNPWLQELPDPITKVTWDNYVCVSPATAAELGLANGDVVAVALGADGARVELPTLIQPGQHDRVLAIALAYGCQGTERFSRIGPQWLEARPTVVEGGVLGQNASRFVAMQEGTRRYIRTGATLAKTGQHRELACTQKYHSLEMPPEVAPHGAEHRETVQHTTLAAFAKNSQSGAVEQHYSTDEQLWPEDHPAAGHAWGMVIDLNKCTGCSACVIACQSENNIPVVGYDEVRRQREMHWLRIDRYYGTAEDGTTVDYQPMMCQHCGNAPCETVCPVLATVHSSEGLNEQVYNRCVGTRYCANNCPYKVRRFNWFKYPHDGSLQNLVLNPDVAVRSRGVMEKCSLCVQRIEAGKIAARSRGETVLDGSVQTACQQSCPARAIVFGDLLDTTSRVTAAQASPRRYRVLEELNVRPAVSYLRVVRNSDEENHRG